MQKEEIYKKFEELDKVAALGGGVVRIDKQHEAGRMTARERIDILKWQSRKSQVSTMRSALFFRKK